MDPFNMLLHSFIVQRLEVKSKSSFSTNEINVKIYSCDKLKFLDKE